MAKKKIPEVRLLFGGDGIVIDWRATKELLVFARLEESELVVSAVQNGDVQIPVKESKSYGQLGVVVLSKREHKRLVDALDEILCGCKSQLDDENNDTDPFITVEAIHNAAARALGKEPW